MKLTYLEPIICIIGIPIVLLPRNYMKWPEERLKNPAKDSFCLNELSKATIESNQNAYYQRINLIGWDLLKYGDQLINY